jgi:TolB protein
MNMKKALLLISAALLFSTALSAQDTFKTGTNMGAEKIKLAVADFKSSGGDAALLQTFNGVLWNDLDQAGIFDLVSKSFYPLAQVGRPEDVNLGSWGNAPANAAMLAFGNFGVSGSDIQMQGWLYDTKNTASPQILGKQYREAANQDNARLIAHRFADEIIFRVGGGIQGIAETKLFFVRAAGGTKEIWSMDYDGEGQHAITNLHAISLSPRISPDGTRLAFASTAKGSWDILMWSFDVNRLVSFPRFGGTNLSPAWSGDGSKLAFSSSRNGDPEIYTADASAGAGINRITAFKGPDVSPVWNPKTNSQIAWVSGRSGLPQIWVMNADGTNPQRLTDEGYAVSPSWSPNGQYLAFSWIRHYGPGAPGAQDIYVMDVATRQFIQLTHNGGRNDFPSWSPDNRHIVFQSSASGSEQIWTMLADGTKQKQLTFSGKNSQPNWSFK